MTERKDIKRDKIEALQNKSPKVKRGDGDEDVNNCLQFSYFGTIFGTPDRWGHDAGHSHSVKVLTGKNPIGRTSIYIYIWAADLLPVLDLKLRLYISSCCSILVNGCEG